MKKIITLLPVLFLSGCFVTVPVKPVFPDPVPELMTSCEALKTVPEGTTKLSDTLSVITQNYGQYHQCSAKVDSWIEWYNEQRKIYNEIN